MILVDSNVIIDILEQDERWFDWSLHHLTQAVVTVGAAINQIVVAEVAPRKGSLGEFVERLDHMMVRIEPFGEEAAFAGGLAFQAYRRLRKREGMILADFLIGGHAQAAGATILTRDPRFYRSYFSGVPLITPSKDD